MTTTQITCPNCAHTYQRTYPKPIICPACGMYLHGCYNRKSVSREPDLWVQDGWQTLSRNDHHEQESKLLRPIPNAFKDQTCQINLPACGDCKWRKHD